MSIIHTTIPDVDYPDSDGRPMGETDLHRRWMIHIDKLLSRRYRGQQAYVSSDLLLYYVAGDNKKFVVPDNFVVLDCDPHERRVFKTWEEGKGPDVVFEVTSRKTRANDEKKKPAIYTRIGVRELFLYDPTSDYLRPPLRGLRRAGDVFVPIEPDSSGALECQVLGLSLTLDGGDLLIADRTTGEPLRTDAAAEAQRADANEARALDEKARADAATARAEAEAARAEAAERELQRLREELKRRGGDPNES